MRSNSASADPRLIVERVTVGIPIYNEEANLGALLGRLIEEPSVENIFAVDDGSTDGSLAILHDFAARSAKVRVLSTGGRAGQLRGWILAAEHATTDRIVFVDADALPERGSIDVLIRAGRESGAAVTSGRVVPDPGSARVPMARFSAAVMHRIRALGYAKEATIGRFFACEREWFLATATRDDIIANDSYLSARARRAGRVVLYVPEARCVFAGATTVADLAAQRQRADRGYAQLRAEAFLRPEDEPPGRAYIAALARSAVADPAGAIAWAIAQFRARFMRAYQVRGHAGTWMTQASTKRSIDSDR